MKIDGKRCCSPPSERKSRLKLNDRRIFISADFSSSIEIAHYKTRFLIDQVTRRRRRMMNARHDIRYRLLDRVRSCVLLQSWYNRTVLSPNKYIYGLPEIIRRGNNAG